MRWRLYGGVLMALLALAGCGGGGGEKSATPAQNALPGSYFVGVGIGDYTNLPADLGDACVNDARAVAATLGGSHPVLLTDAQATKVHIRAAIAEAAANIPPEAYFVFYYSGHGGSGPTMTGAWIDYILPADSLSPNHVNDITDSELKAWLMALPNPAHAIVILDSCFAGAFVDGRAAPASPPFALKALGTLGCTVLAASRSNEISVAFPEMSLFTRCLVEALTTGKQAADVDGDRRITSLEAFNYAAPRATMVWPTQHPFVQPGTNPVLIRY